jgi:hypothetical protein
MFILQRLVSRSSRSLAVMIGFGRAADDRMRGARSGCPEAAAARIAARVRTVPSPRFKSTRYR